MDLEMWILTLASRGGERGEILARAAWAAGPASRQAAEATLMGLEASGLVREEDGRLHITAPGYDRLVNDLVAAMPTPVAVHAQPDRK